MLGLSEPEKCERNEGDTVGAAVGESAGVDDHPVDQAVAELLLKPNRMLDVAGSDGVGELDLDRDRGKVWRLNDQVDLVVGFLVRR